MKIPKWKYAVILLIVLDVIAIGYFSEQYCFSYQNKVAGIHIYECGDKTYLEQKYYKYIHPPNQTLYQSYENLTLVTLWQTNSKQ